MPLTNLIKNRAVPNKGEKMSENNVSDEKSQTSQTESTQETKEQYVAKKAYEEVSKDMHKYKSKAREVEAMKNELESKLKSIEEQKLMEEKRWQELYEKEKEEKSQLAEQREQDFERYLKSAKLAALKQELGGAVKDVYLNHANINEIEIKEDGTLSSESVLNVANQFRKDYPEVIPNTQNLNITSPSSPTQFAESEDKNDLSKMSYEQKAALLDKLQNK